MTRALQGKRTLITGASKGIGRGLAAAFAAQGAEVVAVARDETGLAEVKKEVEEAGSSCHIIRADLADMNDVQRVAAEADTLGVHILVNNAGVSYPQSALEASPENWKRPLPSTCGPLFFSRRRSVIRWWSGAGGASSICRRRPG